MVNLPTAEELSTWRMILQRVEGYLPLLNKAAIAGGCLRDTLLGKPVVDVDIFHEGSLENVDGFNALGFIQQDLLQHAGEYEQPIAIWNGHLYGQRVQLIQVECLEDRLRKFSCSLSEVYYRDNLLQMSPEFIESVRTKTIKFAGWCSDEYMAKMRAKFPEYIAFP